MSYASGTTALKNVGKPASGVALAGSARSESTSLVTTCIFRGVASGRVVSVDVPSGDEEDVAAQREIARAAAREIEAGDLSLRRARGEVEMHLLSGRCVFHLRQVQRGGAAAAESVADRRLEREAIRLAALQRGG